MTYLADAAAVSRALAVERMSARRGRIRRPRRSRHDGVSPRDPRRSHARQHAVPDAHLQCGSQTVGTPPTRARAQAKLNTERIVCGRG